MTDHYYVIGNPVAHSKSPAIHAAFAAQTGQDLAYARCLAPLDGFGATVRRLQAEGARGANVTVPFKQEAFALADSLSARARLAGAVNTLVFADGRIHGDNTDGAGLVRDIEANAGLRLAGARLLLLGAGGAARGVLGPLFDAGVGELVLANRTLATAAALAADFGGRPRVCAFAEVDGSFDLVVNATAASLQAAVPPIPDTVFRSGTLALDMMYGKEPTVFLQFAAQHGARIRDGLGMLVEQAAEAFYVWRGVRPDSGPVLAALRGEC
ncbi:shikimate dehydrogenase [Massilia sp. TS11]|uniref:shikimate dehydrogenase n=1 Tax=Massilia sp. TS11 TaxID=2908003 RepID=UPI001EDA0F37|nr:shikimate dehydrogenase [Massilia sp. TS11]MCG2583446.1 shikimate dehydrogenase [Massilia sp. TS11]